ncbi:MAG: hypothetical protein OJF49_003801 [Ktedonobacterales bacterium]|nr:MAG: hypothetical protein OJF49_003801 [Ktedonobacterales bacterium]
MEQGCAATAIRESRATHANEVTGHAAMVRTMGLANDAQLRYAVVV